MEFGRNAEDACDLVFGMGPVRFNLQGADPAEVARARTEVTGILWTFEETRGGVVPHGDLWLVRAVRPAATPC